jgi:hypothetical protein
LTTRIACRTEVCTTSGGGCGAIGEPWPLQIGLRDGWKYFRLRDDSLHARFFLSPDQRTWLVQLRSGETWELGFPLHRHRADRGNVVLYLWKRSPAGSIGFLTDVYDTPGPSGSKLGGQEYLASFAGHTRLVWERNQFPTDSFAPVMRAQRQLHVVQIDVASQSMTSAARELVRRIHLGYMAMDHHSYLVSYQVEGRCASPVVEKDSALPATSCPLWPATRLQYSKPETPAAMVGDQLSFDVAPTIPTGSKSINYTLADMNSDGLPDLVESGFAPGNPAGGGQQRIYTNGPKQFTQLLKTAQGDFSSMGYTTVGDFSGKGRTEVHYDPNPDLVSLAGDIDAEGTADTLADEDRAGRPGYGDVQRTGDKADVEMRISSRSLVFVGGSSFDWLVTNKVRNTCLFPSWATRNSSTLQWPQRPWPDQSFARFLTDMNGDGVADLAYVTPSSVQYWPGDGAGNFTTCRGDVCACTDNATGHDQDAVTIPAPLGSNALASSVFLHDVNGDGLADLVSATVSGLSVWLNIDGFSFAPTPTTVPSGEIDALKWPTNLQDLAATVRVSFADMNGDGVDDFVVTVADRVYQTVIRGHFGHQAGPALAFADDSSAPRAGILIAIDNGLGAVTRVAYESTADLAKIAMSTGNPWVEPLPQVQLVVGRITVQTPDRRQPGQEAVHLVRLRSARLRRLGAPVPRLPQSAHHHQRGRSLARHGRRYAILSRPLRERGRLQTRRARQRPGTHHAGGAHLARDLRRQRALSLDDGLSLRHRRRGKGYRRLVVPLHLPRPGRRVAVRHGELQTRQRHRRHLGRQLPQGHGDCLRRHSRALGRQSAARARATGDRSRRQHHTADRLRTYPQRRHRDRFPDRVAHRAQANAPRLPGARRPNGDRPVRCRGRATARIFAHASL